MKLDESTQIKANATFAAKLVLGMACGRSVIVNRINALNSKCLKDDIHMNKASSEQMAKGELGALPDDAEQNMRLNFYERELEKVKVIVDELRFKP